MSSESSPLLSREPAKLSRTSSRARLRARVGLLLAVLLLGAAAYILVRAVQSPPPVELRLTNQTPYEWEIKAEASRSAGVERSWRLAPHASRSVELPAGTWRLTQTAWTPNGLLTRSVEETLLANERYEWPLATLAPAQNSFGSTSP